MNGPNQHTGRNSYARKQFRQNKPAVVSLYILALLALVALLAPVIANEKPLFISYKGEKYFPAFSFKNNYIIKNADGSTENIQLDITDWKHLHYDKVIWAPVPYSPGKSDRLNSNYVAPGGDQKFRDASGNIVDMPRHFRHLLGTNNLGEDVLSGIIHGTRISITIGFISMSIATLIGLLLGSIAGFFGDDRIIITRGKFITMMLGVLLLGEWITQAQSARELDPALPPELVLYRLYALACDPVPAVLKAGGRWPDEQVVDWVVDTCLNGLRPRAT